MPTGMFVYAEIAARYGVDPKEEDQIEYFYNVMMVTKSNEEKRAVFLELLARDGEQEGERTDEEKKEADIRREACGTCSLAGVCSYGTGVY